MIALGRGLSYVDLNLCGIPGTIATAVLQGPDGVALIDPGPSSTLDTLRGALRRAGIAMADVNTLLLTHIHLDHAGVTGTLVRENPTLRVYVHEQGAPHMTDPSKLLASAARVFGDAFVTLWGECLPVPAANLVVLRGNERLQAGGREFAVAYTPGHARHHVSYFNGDTGVAFVGDTAGTRMRAGGGVWPPTPPPDIDVEAWHDSIARIRAWDADTLFLTHFGPFGGASAHLTDLADSLDYVASLARQALAREGTEQDREAWWAGELRRKLGQTMSEADATAMELVARLEISWKGLARYWRKRGGDQ